MKNERIQELILEIGKLRKEMLSLQTELKSLRNYDTNIYNGTDFAISSKKLKPSNIEFILK